MNQMIDRRHKPDSVLSLATASRLGLGSDVTGGTSY